MAPQIKYGDFMCISLLRYFNAAELTWRFGYCRTQGRWIKLLLRNLKELRTSVKLVEEVKSMIVAVATTTANLVSCDHCSGVDFLPGTG